MGKVYIYVQHQFRCNDGAVYSAFRFSYEGCNPDTKMVSTIPGEDGDQAEVYVDHFSKY